MCGRGDPLPRQVTTFDTNWARRELASIKSSTRRSQRLIREYKANISEANKTILEAEEEIESIIRKLKTAIRKKKVAEATKNEAKNSINQEKDNISSMNHREEFQSTRLEGFITNHYFEEMKK